MNARQRFLETMNYGRPDRLPFYEFLGYWDQTINRWHGEGLPSGMSVWDYFGFDKMDYVSIDCDAIPSFITRTLQEDERYVTVSVESGGLRWVSKNLKAGTSMPLFLEFGIKDRDDFEKIKARFNPEDMRRYPKNWSDELLDYYRSTDKPVGIGLPGLFGYVRGMTGMERLLVWFHKDPKLVHNMFDFFTDFQINATRKAIEEAKIDFATIWEDMAYRTGPHIPPKAFSEFMLPGYKKITGFLRNHGIDVIMVDSDGDISSLVPLFMEGGVNCPYPLEVQSGMNWMELRGKYGKRLRMIGNIDKRALMEGPDAIRKEVESKLAMASDGGYIPSVDHCVPADVPFENYVYYIELLKGSLSR